MIVKLTAKYDCQVDSQIWLSSWQPNMIVKITAKYCQVDSQIWLSRLQPNMIVKLMAKYDCQDYGQIWLSSWQPNMIVKLTAKYVKIMATWLSRLQPNMIVKLSAKYDCQDYGQIWLSSWQPLMHASFLLHPRCPSTRRKIPTTLATCWWWREPRRESWTGAPPYCCTAKNSPWMTTSGRLSTLHTWSWEAWESVCWVREQLTSLVRKRNHLFVLSKHGKFEWRPQAK